MHVNAECFSTQIPHARDLDETPQFDFTAAAAAAAGKLDQPENKNASPCLFLLQILGKSRSYRSVVLHDGVVQLLSLRGAAG